MGKLKASYHLTLQSFHLMWHDKEIMLFPLFSMLAIGVAFVIFYIASSILSPVELYPDLVAIEDAGTREEIREAIREKILFGQSMTFYAIWFGFYIVSVFIAVFSQAGLMAIVYERIHGGDMTFGGGVRTAARISGKLFLWSVISATVGIIVRVVFERSRTLGKVVVWALGAAWGVMTFFIIPTLLFDDVSVGRSIKNSGRLFRDVWGETLIMNFSIGAVFTVGILVMIFVFFGVIFALDVIQTSIFINRTIIFLFFLLFVSVVLVGSALGAIFKVVLYEYAKSGRITSGFSPELIVGAVRKGEEKRG